jgi:hypothetical protein
MSSKSAYRDRIMAMVGAVLGLATAPPSAIAAIDRAQIETLKVSEKLAEIRAATTIVFERARKDLGSDPGAIEKKLMAQWYNWGNWRNWANWTNWASWASYWNNY